MDYLGLLPEEVWVQVASALKRGADRSAFAQSCRAFAEFEKLSREKVSVTSWAQASGPICLGTFSNKLTSYLSQFPCMQSLRLVGPNSDPEDVEKFAAGFGRYVLPHQVTRETLVSYEPAMAVTHYLGPAERVLSFGALSATIRTEQLYPPALYPLSIDDHILEGLMGACSRVKHLEVRYDDGISGEGLGCLAGVRGLRSLHLVECSAVKDYTPLKRLLQLESLCIQGLGPSTSTSLTDSAVEQIAANCTTLRTLELISHTSLTNAALIAIGQFCRNLSTFKLHPCRAGPIDSQGVAALASLTNLQTLQLTNLVNEIDPAFQPISQQCSGLTSLRITDCPRFSRWALRRLAFHCGKLTKLDVSRCKKLAMYEALVDLKLCTNLEDLTLDHCIIESQPELFKSLGENLGKLRRLFARGCTGMDEASLGYVLLGCRRLDTMVLTHCRLLQSLKWARLPDLASLKTLDLTNCRLNWDEPFSVALAKCTGLTDLSLAFCAQCIVSPDAFEALFVHYPGLKKLSLARNSGWVRDWTLESTFKLSPNLVELNIHGCYLVTDSGLQSLLSLRSLNSLIISECKAITEDGLVRFAKGNPALESLWCDGVAQGSLLDQKTVCRILRGCQRLKKLAVKSLKPTEFIWEKGKILRFSEVR
ncbi:Leucine rich repeat/RNI-like superfamily protein [Klebsormidium nitens]|uniref:Leucine rich repeat/RNI-like superfamily protein n=1 Tax=Klebsormidium nitens TaxID=105231 RepID=A0A1Y1HSV9_KLENI|nr:Leucine rich repeat/RNI-like superfamily protein [Klebsormidium nitens]|eukprot:GAQ81704.1 Leucine rich repeat/RNI-like superfamily protein [Klebsormidium nitens]